MVKRFLSILTALLLLYPSIGRTQNPKTSLHKDPPALSSIKEADLKKDLYAMSADHFRGRSAGTIDELEASVWCADQMRAIGLKPAGDNGTFFQFFSLWRNQVSKKSSISIGNRNFELWKDVLVAQAAPADLTSQIVFLNNPSKADIDNADIKGKAVAVQVSDKEFNQDVSIPEWRYGSFLMRSYGNSLLTKGVSAIIFVVDDFGERSWIQAAENYKRGTFDLEGGPNAVASSKPPILWVHKNALDLLKGSPALKAGIIVDQYLFPSVNVVGKIEGTDPVLKKEYVLFSGHQDAHGIRNPYGTDSIYNGADDNASVNVAMLAVARAFKKHPGKRSILVVFHGAEERGLFGSRWYSSHPTVDGSSIVAVLNGDMIGRNHPDSAAVLGVQPPHRTSSDLVKMALDANSEGPRFKLDTLWDKVDHVEGWFFRSDHLPYVRLGIPSLMYTTLLHPDYHTPMDDAGNIDYKKLKKMTDWIYRTGWKVANAPKRPEREPNFKLER
jgi:hypothetical protein